jgi:hypothetical protein
MLAWQLRSPGSVCHVRSPSPPVTRYAYITGEQSCRHSLTEALLQRRPNARPALVRQVALFVYDLRRCGVDGEVVLDVVVGVARHLPAAALPPSAAIGRNR